MDAYLLISLNASRGDVRSFDGTLVGCYHDAGIFRLNNVEVKMGLKDLALISRLNVISHVFHAR